jgi:Flp pilus assembly protein TadG
MVRGRRRREPAQAVVEFGLLALLFTLLLFAIVDFGLLLNGWVTVSSAAREGARRAAVGMSTAKVVSETQNFAPVPGLAPSEVKVTIAYCSQSGGCTYYCSYASSGPPITGGSGNCTQTSETLVNINPAPDRVEVTVTADKFQVVTPLVRPFFGCSGTQANCFVPLNSSTSMRYEGAGLI